MNAEQLINKLSQFDPRLEVVFSTDTVNARIVKDVELVEAVPLEDNSSMYDYELLGEDEDTDEDTRIVLYIRSDIWRE